MDYNMPLILVLTYLLIIFLILVILIEFTYRANENKSKTKSEEFFRNNTELELKVDVIREKLIILERLIRPVAELANKHEDILSGSKSKGTLGEQFVEERLSSLPHEWYQRKVHFSGGVVEFAIRAPNKRWIPIDSQWTNHDLLLKVEKSESQSQRNLLRAEIHQSVNKYAISALKYLDKERTLGFCVVAIPDIVFNLCVDIQPDLASKNIVLISYSLLVPYILLIFNQYLKTTHTTDSLEISQILKRATAEIEIIQKYITTDVKPPLEEASRNQTQYVRQYQGLEQIHASLNQIQQRIAILKDAVNPVPNSEITSIPPTLQRQLSHVRDGLLEDIAKQQNEPHKDNAGE